MPTPTQTGRPRLQPTRVADVGVAADVDVGVGVGMGA